MRRRWLCIVVAMLCCLLLFATSASALCLPLMTYPQPDINSPGGVPGDVENQNGAFFRLVKCTTIWPPWQAATGGTRHGQRYQGSCASAGP